MAAVTWLGCGESVDRISGVNRSPRQARPAAAGRSAIWRSKFPLHASPGALVQKRARSFRKVLIQVMAVQVITLAALWWLQARYGR
jgi:hypothetical protein